MALAQALFEEYWPRWQRHFSPEARLRLGCVGLAALAGCPPEVADRYLSPEELAHWTGLGQEKRRSEWLGGRLAAKWAAAGLLIEAEAAGRNLVIRTETGGRPFVVPEGGAGAVFISISHSGPLAAALAANLPCGLDIQEPGEKVRRVRQRFAAPEEEDLLQAALPPSFPETNRLTLLWAAKEAVRKMVRVSPLLGFLEMRLLAGHGEGAPQEPLALTFAASRGPDGCPANLSVLCFFADNLAWAMACPSAHKE